MKDALLDDEGRRAVVAATLVSGLLIAQQAAGRATRDALFLSVFPAAFLPVVMMAAAAASIAAVGAVSWALARRSPFRVLPVAAGLSSAFLLLEWALWRVAPRAAAVAVYMHLALFGGTLISGFWSLVNERFDPYTAKRIVGRIALGASVGGVAGGVLAWGAARLIPVPSMLLVMAILTVAAMAGMTALGRGEASAAGSAGGPAAPSALGTLRRVPYLRDLALVVGIGAVTDSLLDYVLKSQAASTFSRGAQLMSFFAVINTAFGLLSLLVQAALSRSSLRTLGLAGTVAVRPATVLVVALLGLLDPRMWVAVLARAGQEVNTSSLFRSAYELLFTPLPEAEKRPTKAVVDVGFDKLGSLVGGAIALLAVTLVPTQTARVLFAFAAALCLGALAFTGRLHRGYVRTLEQSLRAGRVRLDPSEVPDEATRLTLAQTGLALDRDTLLREIQALRTRDESGGEDAVLQAFADLRSGDPERVRLVLRQRPERSAALVPHLVPLLARDDLFVEVLRALRRVAPAVTGQLLDALLDPAEDPAVRRRLPRVLKVCSTRRAVHGLFLGLEDPRLDVRAQCALALASITGRNPELTMPRSDVFAAVRRELEEAEGRPDLDHVFTLLSLTLEREPLHISLQAVRGSDRALRGTALEYLENVLPEGLRAALWPSLGERVPPARRARPREDVMNELLSSSAAVPLSRAALRARLPLGPPTRKREA
jgi:ATP:ADP antiporter, AAA family